MQAGILISCRRATWEGVRRLAMVLIFNSNAGPSRSRSLLPAAIVFDLGWAEKWAQSPSVRSPELCYAIKSFPSTPKRPAGAFIKHCLSAHT